VEHRDQEIYLLSRRLSKEAWIQYEAFREDVRRVIGNQWIRSIDSIGANFAEGSGRYGYPDRNRFNYIARGSLREAMHWTELLKERNILDSSVADNLLAVLENLAIKLNVQIKNTRAQISGS